MSSAREEWRSTRAAISKFYKSVLKTPDPDSSDDEDEINDSYESIHLYPAADYQYVSALREDCIRLLELQPGQRHDPIVCRLQETRLASCAGQYDALSYVWGPSDMPFRIRVDDGGLNIRPNLHCALANLRHPDRSRLLWVDAICINQSDNSERNAQVPIMREIYRNAACTICFLGPKHNTTRAMYAMLEDLAREARTLQTDGHSLDEMDTVPAFVNNLSIHPVKSELSKKYLGDVSVLSMAACNWWHRVWTVQEMLLSPNVVFTFGRHTINWETVCLAMDHGFNIQIWTPISFGFVMDRATIPYLSMRALMARRRLQRSDPSRQPAESSAYDLLHLLNHCRHRGSTDPRDKVYAVLGLLRNAHSEALSPNNPEGLSIKLDYNYPVAYVYRKTAQAIISKMNNLDILGTCPKTYRRGLPSWVSDWSVTSPIGSPLTQDSLDRGRTSHATKNTKADARFPDDGVTMIVRGHKLTSIEELAETLPTLDHNSPDDCGYYTSPEVPIPKRAWLVGIGAIFEAEHELLRDLMSIYRTLFAWARFADSEPATNKSDDPESVFWQTLCAGTYSSGGLEATATLFKAWFDGMQPLRKFMERYPGTSSHAPELAFVRLVSSTWKSYGEFWPYVMCAQHRRLGRTENGWLCLLPEDTQVGDDIILACGGRVPLVIRSDGDGYNMFVGEAYIQGVMDGEAFDAERCVDIKIC